MQVKEIVIGIPLLLFILWIFAAPFPQERIVRTCEPVNWIGNIATSTTALSSEDHTETSIRWSDKLNYSCRYMVWRLIYQDAYNKAIKDGLITPAATIAEDVSKAPATSPAAATSAPATKP